MKQSNLNLINRKSVPTDKQKQIEYIRTYYGKSILTNKKDHGLQFGLPHPYLVPDCDFFTEFFYWDTFFMVVGLLKFKEGKKLSKGIIQNFTYEMERFGRIPNNNAYYSLSRSQSPYFALTIKEYLRIYPKDINAPWIQKAVRAAEKEYTDMWTSNDIRNANYRTETGLSRHWDIHGDLDIFAEYESGWDTTSRFLNRCMSINPIDLNSQLYVYEEFFEWYHKETGDTKASQSWKKKKQNRKKLINEYCWNEKDGVFYDYDVENKKQTGFLSSASFYPLYAGIATEEQAKRSVNKLMKALDAEGGLAITQKVDKKASYTNQWDYPNGWAPLMFIAYHGMKKYGFEKEAETVKSKWVALCDYWFVKDGCFYEKYNVDDIKSDVISKTPRRRGFGWTNGVYLDFVLE